MSSPVRNPEFDKLIGFSEGETWLGFNIVRTDTPSSSLVRALFQIKLDFLSSPLVTLDTDDTSEFEITVPSTWAATAKSRILQSSAGNLPAADYVWSLWVETAAGDAFTWAIGNIKGCPHYTDVP